MAYVNLKDFGNLQAGRKFLTEIGKRTPEQLADDLGESRIFVAICVSLAKKERDVFNRKFNKK